MPFSNDGRRRVMHPCVVSGKFLCSNSYLVQPCLAFYLLIWRCNHQRGTLLRCSLNEDCQTTNSLFLVLAAFEKNREARKLLFLIYKTINLCPMIQAHIAAASNVQIWGWDHDLKSLEDVVGFKIGVGFKIESLPFWHFSCAKEGNFSLAKIFKKRFWSQKLKIDWF